MTVEASGGVRVAGWFWFLVGVITTSLATVALDLVTYRISPLFWDYVDNKLSALSFLQKKQALPDYRTIYRLKEGQTNAALFVGERITLILMSMLLIALSILLVLLIVLNNPDLSSPKPQGIDLTERNLRDLGLVLFFMVASGAAVFVFMNTATQIRLAFLRTEDFPKYQAALFKRLDIEPTGDTDPDTIRDLLKAKEPIKKG